MIYMSPQIYRHARVRDAEQMLERLRDLECLPGKDELVERELNRRIIAYRVGGAGTISNQRLPSTYLHVTLALPERLFAGRDASQLPIAYRAALAKHASDIWRDWKNLPRIDDEYAMERNDLVSMHIRAEEAIRRDIFEVFDAPRPNSVFQLRRLPHTG